MSGFTDDNDTEETKWYLVTPHTKSQYKKLLARKCMVILGYLLNYKNMEIR